MESLKRQVAHQKGFFMDYYKEMPMEFSKVASTHVYC